MDSFVKSLSISNNTTIEEVIRPCCKLLNWLNLSSAIQLTHRDIDVILKAAVFIDECLELFGDELLLTSICREYPFYKTKFENCFKEFRASGCLVYACTNIIKTKNGPKHIFAMEHILKSLKEKSQVVEIIQSISSSDLTVSESSKNRDKLHYLVQRLFQLPSAQIDMALERVLNQLQFNVIALVFLESPTSPHYDRCAILERKICEKIAACSVSEFFLHSMFVSASTSQKGRQFFGKCLDNAVFADSLSAFFIKYLGSIDAEIDSDGLFYYEHPVYKDYSISHILFLVCCLLTTKLECRHNLFNKLYNSNVSPKMVDYINKLIFIYS